VFTALRFLRGRAMDAAHYPELLAEAFGAHAGAVAQRYPPDRFGGVPLAYSTAMTDGDFACVADRMADALAKTQPVYAYEFNDRGVPAPEPLREAPFHIGAGHSLELRYLFDVGGAPLNPAQLRLSEEMIDYWSQFVSTGAPGAVEQREWPELGNDESGERMSLEPDGNRVVTTFEQAHQCPFWASLK
jgi:para-nitrobenzyl esterase